MSAKMEDREEQDVDRAGRVGCDRGDRPHINTDGHVNMAEDQH